MEVLQKGAGVCKPPAGPWQSPFWLFVAEDIKTASIKINTANSLSKSMQILSQPNFLANIPTPGQI